MTRLLTVLLLSLCAARLDAQVLYGSLVGNVSDPSQGAVPNAKVTVTNTGTGQVRETASDERGFYAFRDLLEGSYDLRITAAGFAAYARTAIPITINTVSRVDVAMQVGQLTESITVAAAAVALQTDKADVHADIGAREVTNLPLTGYRNYQSLMNLVPGATPARYQNAMIDSPARALTSNVNGATRNSNTTRVDGALNVFVWLPHHTVYVPPAESIETVNITTNSFDAEQGLAGGAAVNVSTKSGTNQFHGVAFNHHNNSHMAARNFFYVERNLPKTIQNQYGATLGGPVRRDKVFFFTSWEALRNRVNASGFNTVPGPDVRQGDFNAYSTTIYDPETGNPDGRGRQAFPGNRIPASRLSPIALKMQSFLPGPNQPGLSNNHFSSGPVVFDRDNGDAKVNFNASPALAIWGKYSIMNATVTGVPRLGEAGGTGLGTDGSGTGHTLVQVAAIGVTRTISTRFIVDGTIGFSRFGQNVRGPDFGKNFGLEVLGIPGTNGPDIRQSGQPIFAVSNYTTFGNPSTWSPLFRNDNSYSYTANAAFTTGPHNLRWGVDIGRYHMNHWQPERGGRGPRGQFAFTGGLTALNGGPAPNQFNSWADYLLGLTQNFGKSYQVMSPMSTRDWQDALYFRDQWQATRNLTVTLGLRWEYFPLMTRASRGIERYDTEANKVLIGGRGNIPDNAGTSVSKRLFAPRIGLAYRLGGNMVVRAGYGISIDPYALGRPLRDNFPVVISQEFTGTSTYVNAGRLATGLPPVVFPDESTGIIDIPGTVANRTLLPGRFNRGYIQSFNFMVQRELPGHFAAQAGYVGTRSIRQMMFYEINAGLVPGAGARGQPLFQKFGRAASTAVLMPFQTVNYNSLQAKLDRRFAAGLMMTWAYTYSKALNYQDDSTEGGWMFYLPGHQQRNRAPAGYDRTHNLQMSSIYDLPFGKGRRYANGGLAAALAGGWQVNAVLSSYTGRPFTVTAPGTSLNAPSNNQTADQVKEEVTKLGGVGRGNPFFDTTAFRTVTEPRLGNTGRNILRGPGAINVNLGLFRTFDLSERFKLQFRAESFNVSNTPHFNNPDGSVNSSSFGIINSTAGTAGEDDSRLFRVALRLSF